MTRFLTADDVIMHALDLFWFKGEQQLARQLLCLITDWREDQALMQKTGEDGAL